MATTINTTAINTEVRNALKAAGAYGVSVSNLKTLLRGVLREQAQDIITQPIATYYGAAIKDGTRGLTFEGRGTPAYEAAKRARSRLLAAVYGSSTSAHAAPAVARFDRARVSALQDAVAGLTKAQAKAYMAKALEAAFA